ncbi:MAG: hypothetical protein KBD78_04990 [Oligoflexales bacterium]|nr:hypothetical protein [Oligoflexales bacterium]
MIKNFKHLNIVLSAIFLTQTSCYQKNLLFQAESVSMTKSNSGDSSIKVGDEVSEKWCVGDKVLIGDKNVVGVADQVIYKAQGKGKSADFIVEAKVYVDTNNCALIDGKRAKISGGKAKISSTEVGTKQTRS